MTKFELALLTFVEAVIIVTAILGVVYLFSEKRKQTMKSLYLYIIQTIIKPKGIVDCDDAYLLKEEHLGPAVVLIAWPGKGCFIGTQNQEPSNITYFEDEIQMASLTHIIAYCIVKTPISVYKEQQLN